jgi:uncharacterized protein (DUF305 family)
VKRALAPWSLLLALTLSTACGSGESSSGSQGNASDRAFLNDMIPHHRMAVDMGRTAQREADHRELRTLASSIVADQREEISLMGKLKRQVEAGDASSTFGMSMREMGMDMDMDAFMRARPFDRTFIDDMVPHHEGAVDMAKLELAKGRHPQVRSLARRIIRSQSGEIRKMNAYRKRWYGPPTRVPE